MLRSLLCQIYQLTEKGQSKLQQLYVSCDHGRQQPETQTLATLLIDTLSEIGNTKIVIDALDESKTQDDLLGWLASPVQNYASFLLTSRKEEDLESIILGWTKPADIVSIRKLAVDDDIRAVVRSCFAQDLELQRWQSMPNVYDDIEEALMTKANGVFRWAICQLDALKKCLDRPSLEQALSSLPKTLDETYDRILEEIPNYYRPQAVRLLQFLTFAERPLRLEEAVDMLAVSLGATPAFVERDRMPNPNEIARFCPNFIKIANGPGNMAGQKDISYNPLKRKYSSSMISDTHEDESIQGKKSNTYVIVHLTHFSGREYLASGRISK
ncbi:hypothetical protein K431DRAFT_225924, partial [Polychaeton citri CBS 116435]